VHVDVIKDFLETVDIVRNVQIAVLMVTFHRLVCLIVPVMCQNVIAWMGTMGMGEFVSSVKCVMSMEG
jgi:hypothetical protein